MTPRRKVSAKLYVKFWRKGVRKRDRSMLTTARHDDAIKASVVDFPIDKPRNSVKWDLS